MKICKKKAIFASLVNFAVEELCRSKMTNNGSNDVAELRRAFGATQKSLRSTSSLQLNPAIFQRYYDMKMTKLTQICAEWTKKSKKYSILIGTGSGLVGLWMRWPFVPPAAKMAKVGQKRPGRPQLAKKVTPSMERTFSEGKHGISRTN